MADVSWCQPSGRGVMQRARRLVFVFDLNTHTQAEQRDRGGMRRASTGFIQTLIPSGEMCGGVEVWGCV